MKNLAPKLSPEEYEANFAEIHPALTQNSASTEANRCLYCYDSPCMKACPTHIDISTFIKKIATGNVKGAAKTILQSNWIALTCAKACPVEILCEGACVYNERGETPIQIGRLQRFAIDRYFEQGMPPLFTPAPRNGKSVGVIGAGPAGLACAAELALMGYEVVIYEAKEKPGGLDMWGIAPYKVHQKDSLNEVKLVESFGVRIKPRTRVGKEVSLEALVNTHDAMFIGIGLGTATELTIPGEDLDGVVDALEFIEKVTTRKWTSVDVGRRVAVIGAGNTAIDAATEARRLGAAQVMILYRRERAQMPAFDFEYELATREGVVFHFLTAPKRIIGSGHVEGIECVRMRLGEPDPGGRRKPEPIPGSEFQISVDMVIKSVGQNIEKTFLSSIPGLKFSNGLVVVDPRTYQTGNPQFFAGGDCINGGMEVVNAAFDGKQAAHGIDKFIFGKQGTSDGRSLH
jgi:dihydropyrimidine dehydrogenase (NAD+) subunit PreT